MQRTSTYDEDIQLLIIVLITFNIKKLSNTEAELQKCIAYQKASIFCL